MLDVFVAAKRLALEGLIEDLRDLQRVEVILKIKRASPYPRPRIVDEQASDIFPMQVE